MDNKDLCNLLLTNIPYQTMHVKKKSFCTLSFGWDGYIWVMKKGLLLCVRSMEDSRYKGLGIYDEYSLIGIGGLREETRHMTAYALGNSTLSCLPTKEVLAFLGKNNQACYAFMLNMSTTLLGAWNDLEINTLGTLEERLQAFEKLVAGKTLPRDVNFSEAVMAMSIGAHPGSISRLRKQLKKEKKGAPAEEGQRPQR